MSAYFIHLTVQRLKEVVFFLKVLAQRIVLIFNMQLRLSAYLRLKLIWGYCIHHTLLYMYIQIMGRIVHIYFYF